MADSKCTRSKPSRRRNCLASDWDKPKCSLDVAPKADRAFFGDFLFIFANSTGPFRNPQIDRFCQRFTGGKISTSQPTHCKVIIFMACFAKWLGRKNACAC